MDPLKVRVLCKENSTAAAHFQRSVYLILVLAIFTDRFASFCIKKTLANNLVPERCCATCRTWDLGNWAFFEKTPTFKNGERNGYKIQRAPQKTIWFLGIQQECSQTQETSEAWIPGLPRIGQNALKAAQLWWKVIWKPSCGAVFIMICGMNEKYRSNLVQIHSIHAWNGVFDCGWVRKMMDRVDICFYQLSTAGV